MARERFARCQVCNMMVALTHPRLSRRFQRIATHLRVDQERSRAEASWHVERCAGSLKKVRGTSRAATEAEVRQAEVMRELQQSQQVEEEPTPTRPKGRKNQEVRKV